MAKDSERVYLSYEELEEEVFPSRSKSSASSSTADIAAESLLAVQEALEHVQSTARSAD